MSSDSEKARQLLFRIVQGTLRVSATPNPPRDDPRVAV